MLFFSPSSESTFIDNFTYCLATSNSHSQQMNYPVRSRLKFPPAPSLGATGSLLSKCVLAVCCMLPPGRQQTKIKLLPLRTQLIKHLLTKRFMRKHTENALNNEHFPLYNHQTLST